MLRGPGVEPNQIPTLPVGPQTEQTLFPRNTNIQMLPTEKKHWMGFAWSMGPAVTRGHAGEKSGKNLANRNAACSWVPAALPTCPSLSCNPKYRSLSLFNRKIAFLLKSVGRVGEGSLVALYSKERRKGSVLVC